MISSNAAAASGEIRLFVPGLKKILGPFGPSGLGLINLQVSSGWAAANDCGVPADASELVAAGASWTEGCAGSKSGGPPQDCGRDGSLASLYSMDSRSDCAAEASD